MQIYIVRHGIAEDGGEGMPDGSRALTGKGRRRFQKTARAFGRLGHKLDLILTSPLVRAVQTAEILAGATDPGEVAVLEELDARFDVAALRAAAAKRAGKAAAVALVGHEPQLSAALAAFCGVKASELDVKKGSIVRVDVVRLDDDKPADGRWWLKPRSGSRAKGLPLSRETARRLREDARRATAPKRKGAARSERRRASGGRGSRPRTASAESPATT